jgi:hypothetical protein
MATRKEKTEAPSLEDVFPWFTWRRRAFFYSIVEKTSPLVIATGMVTHTTWVIVVGIVEALLGNSAAALHTSIIRPVNTPNASVPEGT